MTTEKHPHFVLACWLASACSEVHSAGMEYSDPGQEVGFSVGSSSSSALDAGSAAALDRAATDAATELLDAATGSVLDPFASQPTTLAPADLAASPPDEACAVRRFSVLAPSVGIRVTETCSFRLNEWPRVTDRDVRVSVASEGRLPGVTSDGWQIGADGLTITLLGAACDDARSGASIEFQLLCMGGPLD